MKPDVLLTHIGKLATLEGNSEAPKTGEGMKELSIVEDAAVAIKDGAIAAVGTTKDVLAQVTDDPTLPSLEFPGMLGLPGFIDSHTHLVFGGSRENDFTMKLAGRTYMEILRTGGGILNTVRATRAASRDQLSNLAYSFASNMLGEGTTTVEAKSGYGLNVADETKILEVVDALRGRLPTGFVSTFLGAHAVPPEFEGKTNDYVDLVVNKMVPAVTKRRLAEFCDVFCEKGAFDIEQSRRILLAAKKAGLKLKVHADEIVHLGGADLAAEVGAISADHLLMASDDGLEAMRKAGTIATLLPGTSFSMNSEFANARKMIEMGLPIALATDFNPNCANESLFFTIALACHKMRIHPREAISAVTINAAHALSRGHSIGSIEEGKRADIIILDCPNPEYLAYRFGVNLVHTVIANGQVIHTRLGP